MTRLPLLLCALALLSACPTFPEDGLYACETDDDCLDDQFCIDGACLAQLPPSVCGDAFCNALECALCPDDCGGLEGEICRTCTDDEACGAEEDCACRDCGGRDPGCGLCTGVCPESPNIDQCNFCPECDGTTACGAAVEDCVQPGDDDLDSLADCDDPDCATALHCATCNDGLCDLGVGECGFCLECADMEGCTETNCLDGRDDDRDDEIDCADLDCQATAACVGEDCTIRGDDEADGLADCQDNECVDIGLCDGGESCEVVGDEDADGFADCADPECFEAGSCQPAEVCTGGLDEDADGLFDCDDGDCLGTLDCPGGGELCGNGFDDDGDGGVDCLDADCEVDPGCPYSVFHGLDACIDLQVDTDGDGLRPCADPECAAFGLDCSTDGEANCVNGLDDDGTGLTDCDDSACWGIGACAFANSSSEATACTNGADDDRDGRTDCGDPSCNGEQSCTAVAIPEPECGNGLDDDRLNGVDCFDPIACTFELAPGCRPGRCVDLLGDVQPIAALKPDAGLASWTGSYVFGPTIAIHTRCGATVDQAPYVLFGFQPPEDGLYSIDALGSGVATAIAVHKTNDTGLCELVPPDADPVADAACPRLGGSSSAWASSGFGSFQLNAADLYYVLLLPLDQAILDGTPLRLTVLTR